MKHSRARRKGGAVSQQSQKRNSKCPLIVEESCKTLNTKPQGKMFALVGKDEIENGVVTLQFSPISKARSGRLMKRVRFTRGQRGLQGAKL
jgi:hypothetical protein